MTTISGSLLASSVIVASRSGHSRLWDHNGTQPDTVVVLDGAIGGFPAGSTVHDVLASLVTRLTELESGSRRVWMFPASAFVQPRFVADGVVLRPGIAGSFAADAWKSRGGLMSADAIITMSPAFFSARAFLIDHLT